MFGNLTTVVSVTLIVFEVPWVIAMRRFGANRALGTGAAHALALHTLLGMFEASISPGFAYLFSTIYPQNAAGKRVMMGNLANCTSGAFGGLFAYGEQKMGTRRGLFCVTIVIGGIGLIILPKTPEDAWFLNEEEKETMRLRKKRVEAFRGHDEFERKCIKRSLIDPFIYVSGMAFFTSSVAITGFGVFLPTIIQGLEYTSLRVNYMTIPVYVLGGILLITNFFPSDQV
ncbi:Major facilitator superfamily domain, general substrate transporter [Niveomyces insectorum RCEF 264]|uniref:Major facilitator superfamily domain, general substrate transporter n=1 Tax=Niveomyces insectorum RCEF 264 TaxID=1081102 RepID=A0A167PJT4_9HYPO|nr:Major facilitator superfamily domain, general substrate transporter [Niveomyces insectorum RCEF 264]